MVFAYHDFVIAVELAVSIDRSLAMSCAYKDIKLKVADCAAFNCINPC